MDGFYQKTHQSRNLAHGTGPVFSGKCIQSQKLNTQLSCCFCDIPYRLYTIFMTEDAWFSILFCPSSIPIHDDGNVLGQFAPVYLDRKSTRLNSSHVATSYAVLCLQE